MSTKGYQLINSSDYPNFEDAVLQSLSTGLPIVMDNDVTVPSLSSKFWSVTSFLGSGSITVGSGTTFRPNPENTGQVNRIYYNSLTGSDSNSGLDPEKPLKTFARVVTFLNLKKDIWKSGKTEILIQAGVHKDNLRSVGSMGPFTSRLRISGEVGSFGEKLATIDGTGTSNKVGIWLEPSIYATIENLVIANWMSPDTADDDAPDTGAGIVSKGGGDVDVRNVEVYNCSQGIGAINQSKMLIVNSYIHDCVTGVRCLYESTMTCGTLSSPNVITRCSMHGVFISRNAVAHVDYNDISYCDTGIAGDMAARFANLGGHIHNNRIGVRASGAAEMIISPNVVFSDNEIERAFWGLGREARVMSGEGTANEVCIYKTVDLQTIKGIDRGSLIFTGSAKYLPQGYFANKGQKLRYKINGNWSGTGKRDFQIQFRNPKDASNVSKIDFTIPSGARGYRFVAEVEIYAYSRTSLYYSIEFRFHGDAPYMISGSTSKMDTSYPWAFAFFVYQGAETDTLLVRQAELYLQG